MKENWLVSWGHFVLRFRHARPEGANESTLPDDARAAAKRFARGNIPTQLGHILTEDDLEAQRRAAARIVFP